MTNPSKEFEMIQQVINTKKNELEIQSRAKQREEENIKIKEERLIQQQKNESEIRSIENKKILENSGIVKLFEEIRDSGLVKMSNEPFYIDQPQYRETLFSGRKFVGNERVKVSDYEPAKIVWGHECEAVSLVFNKHSVITQEGWGDYPDVSEPYYNHCTFVLSPSKEIELENSHDQSWMILENGSHYSINGSNKIELKNIPNAVAEVLTKCVN